MSEAEKLRSVVAKFESTVQQSWSLADANFDGNRQEVLALRRLIVRQLAVIGSLGVAALSPKGYGEAFRHQFSEMRSVIALHHADWPIVAIKLDDPGYIFSANKLRRTTESFMIWIKAALNSAKAT